MAQQRVNVVDQQGQEHVFRRVRIKLKHATRDGATIVHLLTNLPRQVSGTRVADLYRKRWTLETAFQHLEAYFGKFHNQQKVNNSCVGQTWALRHTAPHVAVLISALR